MNINFSGLTNKQLKQYNKNDKRMRTLADYTTLYEKGLSLREDMLFAESYSGNFLSYTIVQFIKQLLNANDKMKVVLSTKNIDDFHRAFSADEQKRIFVVKRNTNKYAYAITQAKYIINDGDFPEYFIARDGQIVINTAESFLGFYGDAELSHYEKKAQRAILQSDYFLMSEFAQQKLFQRLHLHKLKDIQLGMLKPKSTQVEHPVANVDIVFLQKNSQLDSEQALKDFISEHNLPSNLVILVHPSELEKYEAFPELGEYVRAFDYSMVNYIDQVKAIYAESELLLLNSAFDNLDKYIIHDNLSVSPVTAKVQHDEYLANQLLFEKDKWQHVPMTKKNIIIYAGGFQNNGVTTSAINLSFNMDYEKYNLIYLDKFNFDAASLNNISKLSDKSTVIYRNGATDLLMEERFAYDTVQSVDGYNSLNKKNKKYASAAFKRELTRIIGSIDIDVAIDFSGYVIFWNSIMAFSGARVKLIYQHNDMYAELSKVVDGNLKHANKLPQVFQLYQFFDSIVSVGYKTLELNAAHLSQYAGKEKYKYVSNSIWVEDIIAKANDTSQIVQINHRDYLDENGAFEMLPNENEFTLVNIGRMGTEKDQKKLINAFNEAKKMVKGSMKLFILGSGELEADLKQQVVDLNLESEVIFSGQVHNPYIFLKRGTTFILSSNHEGQPMVLLESLALGKPIIATDIAGNRSVLGDEFEDYLVDNSIDGLTQGIVENYHKWENGTLENKYLDINKYNANAMNLFYDAIQ